MKDLLVKETRFLDEPLGVAPRVLLLAATLFLVFTYVFPLWQLTMFAPQYPEGLRMDIYSYRLEGGNKGQDIKEINILNHYIGMKDIETADFTEFKWIPFVVGVMGLLFLRAAILGKIATLVDVFVLFCYFGAFSLWSFGYKLWSYGHNLAPTASVKVPPFMPPLFGFKQLANFGVYSYPRLGSYALALAAACLAVGLLLAWRSARGAVTKTPSPA